MIFSGARSIDRDHDISAPHSEQIGALSRARGFLCCDCSHRRSASAARRCSS